MKKKYENNIELYGYENIFETFFLLLEKVKHQNKILGEVIDEKEITAFEKKIENEKKQTLKSFLKERNINVIFLQLFNEVDKLQIKVFDTYEFKKDKKELNQEENSELKKSIFETEQMLLKLKKKLTDNMDKIVFLDSLPTDFYESCSEYWSVSNYKSADKEFIKKYAKEHLNSFNQLEPWIENIKLPKNFNNNFNSFMFKEMNSFETPEGTENVTSEKLNFSEKLKKLIGLDKNKNNDKPKLK